MRSSEHCFLKRPILSIDTVANLSMRPSKHRQMLKRLLAFFQSFMGWLKKPEEPNSKEYHLRSSKAQKQEFAKKVEIYNLKLALLGRFCKVFNYNPEAAEAKENRLSKYRKKTGLHFVRHQMA